VINPASKKLGGKKEKKRRKEREREREREREILHDSKLFHFLELSLRCSQNLAKSSCG